MQFFPNYLITMTAHIAHPSVLPFEMYVIDPGEPHLQTCKVKSVVSQVHDWVVYLLVGIFGSVGHRVQIHKITPTMGKELGDLEIKDNVVLQKPQEQVDHLPLPRTLILDFTLTHT
jgi:hypothetical protein